MKNRLVMQRNDAVEEIIEYISGREPDWRNISYEIRDEMLFYPDGRRRKDPNILDVQEVARLASIHHLNFCLEEMEDVLGPHSVDLDPIATGENNGKYTFTYDNNDALHTIDNVATSRAGHAIERPLIQRLAFVDNLLTFFRIRLRRKYYTNNGFAPQPPYVRKPVEQRLRTEPGANHLSMPRLMADDFVHYLTDPVMNHYKKHLNIGNFAFVMLVLPDHIRPEEPNQKDFIGRGGTLVPFYADRDQYLADIRTMQAQHLTEFYQRQN